VEEVSSTGLITDSEESLQWDTVEKTAIQEKKIRVNWLAGPDGPAVVATPNRHSLANGVGILLVTSMRYKEY
jgi:hypothetical protein